MSIPYRKIIVETIVFGVLLALLLTFVPGLQREVASWGEWWRNLMTGLIAGFLVALASWRGKTYLQRKNARWKAKKEKKERVHK